MRRRQLCVSEVKFDIRQRKSADHTVLLAPAAFRAAAARR